MKDPVFSYCFKCERAYATEYEDMRLRQESLHCTYCGELTHEHSCSWNAVRSWKEGRHFPEKPQEGEVYHLKRR